MTKTTRTTMKKRPARVSPQPRKRTADERPDPDRPCVIGGPLYAVIIAGPKVKPYICTMGNRKEALRGVEKFNAMCEGSPTQAHMRRLVLGYAD